MHVRVRRLPRGERVFNAAIEARWPPRTGNNISGTVKLVAYGNLVIWIRFFVCVCVCVCVCEKERALPWVLWERKNRKSGGSRVTFYMAAGRSVYFFQSTAATAGAALEMHTILHDVWSVIFALIGPDSGTHTHTHTHTHKNGWIFQVPHLPFYFFVICSVLPPMLNARVFWFIAWVTSARRRPAVTAVGPPSFASR